MKLLLFDIDGTLMLSGGAGHRAIDRAFAELYGIAGAFGDLAPDGKTDPQIFCEIFATRGLEIADHSAAVRELAEVYARHMAAEMAASEQARLMPGAAELVEALAGRDDLALGLLTGNFETTGRLKLAHFGLDRHFAFGAFASDDGDRNRLVPIAVARAERHLGRRLGLGRHVVVIGDTPRDVECALAHGATAVGVAASRYSVDELSAAGAHHALPSLEDIPAFMEAIERCQEKQS
ncbi:MAG: haloacid dehalogenase-like hydrolase [Thermoanaerobaculales bacterium]|jgi:phosphoglycolate phosphatase-like HAD superfamily hydrolase|nr:haloacid dehalogenase-like hydrolase [Thermoanaerobaculales bacterium]